MTPLVEAIWWTLLAAGLIFNAMYSGLETGMYFLNRVKLEVRAAQGPHRLAARILKEEIQRPERLLASNLIATVICGDVAATAASQLLAAHGYGDGAIILINAAILTPVFFVFLETIPKELFRLEADALTYALAGVVAGTRRLLTAVGVLPLVRLVVAWVGRAVGGEGEAGLAITARERIATMLKDSAATGVLSESQAGLVDRALGFHQTEVGDEMVPWARVRAIPADWTREQAVRLLSRERYSFWPLVERKGGEVRVIGIVRHQDVFLRQGVPLMALALPPARLPARMRLHDAVPRLRDAAVPTGIVEEGGRPIGLVTMSDLIEPLVG